MRPGDVQVSKEVLGARDTLAGCGIPASELRGFRTPFLSDSPIIREVLYDNGFRCVPAGLLCPSVVSFPGSRPRCKVLGKAAEADARGARRHHSAPHCQCVARSFTTVPACPPAYAPCGTQV